MKSLLEMGSHGKGLFQKTKPRLKAKVRVVSMNLKRVYQKTLQLADLVCACLETVNMNGSGTIVAKVAFTLYSGAAVSVAPKSLRDDYRMVIEEPRL